MGRLADQVARQKSKDIPALERQAKVGYGIVVLGLLLLVLAVVYPLGAEPALIVIGVIDLVAGYMLVLRAEFYVALLQ